MVSYKKLHDAEECGETACEDDLNYKNALSFLSTENYQNLLNNYSQNHFLNDGTKILQDDTIQDILYGQVSDTKQPLQNMDPKKMNGPYTGDQNVSNFYHTLTTSELRQPQAKEIDQNGSCFDFPMDLSNIFLQNSGLYESQDTYPSMNSACSLDLLADPISTSSHCFATYDEPKNVQSNAFYHFTKDHFSESAGIFSDGIYTKGFEILRENSEHKFQSLPCLEPSIKGSASLNGFNDVKDFTISSYYNNNDNNNNNNNNNKLKLNNSTTSLSAVEKSCHSEMMTSQNVSPLTEFTVPNSSQSLNYQVMGNFDHVLPSFKNPSVPDFPIFNVPVHELPPDVKVADLPSNMKPNQTAEISVGSKNGNLSFQTRYYEALRKNVHLTNKGNCDISFNPPKTTSKELKPFEHVLKHKSSFKFDDLKLTANKRSKPDYVKILPAVGPSKQIPAVNITIHHVPNTCKIPPSNYVDFAVPNIQNNLPMVNHNLGYANRNLTKLSTSKKAVKKIPVSIKARNAKFLCAEKDLRCRTVRELLETCETIQGKTGMKVGPRMNISSVPAENFYELTPQTPLSQMDCLNNSNNPVKMENKNIETFQLQTWMENKNIETFQLQTPQDFHEGKKNGINLPAQRIYEKSNPKTNVSPDDLVKVYQPVVDTWKMVKFASDKKNAFKPKHFDFSFLQIRNFKYFCTESDEKRTSKLKLIFSKKKLVYEFQLKETLDSSGGCMKHLAMIEIKFASIVAMWGYNSEFRIEVNEAPHMYVGTRLCNKDQHFGPHQNAQYDRSQTADLTLGELYQVPFHYIQLRSVCVNKVLSYMSHFSPHFERMLRCPLIENVHKVLPQMQLTPPELVPLRINKIYMPNTGLELNKPEVPSLVVSNKWQPEVINLRQQIKSEPRKFRHCPHIMSFL